MHMTWISLVAENECMLILNIDSVWARTKFMGIG